MKKTPVENYITHHKKCPLCDSTAGVFVKYRVKGLLRDNTGFDGQKLNETMWDSLKEIWNGSFIFCIECDKKLAHIKKYTV